MPLIHICVKVLIVCLMFALGCRFRKKKNIVIGLMICSVFIALFGFSLSSNPQISTWIFPYRDNIYYSNLYPAAVALFAALAFQFGKSRFMKIRIGLLLSLLFLLSLVPDQYFWLAAAHTYNQTVIDDDGICRQSSVDTCGAAAMVTLLRLYGISTTEERAASLALTKEKRGTWVLGQYRALKILLEENRSGLRVRIKRLSVDELLDLGVPAIVTTGLRSDFEPRSEEEHNMIDKWSWTPGVMHDVVYLGLVKGEPELVRIGEPDFGLESWRISGLKILHQGYAIYLEPAS